MRRRGFLKGLFGAALVPIVGKGDGVSLMSIPHPPAGNACVEEMASNVGFGLAPVRPEGATVPFDPMPSKRWVSHQSLENEVWEVTDKRVLAF